MGRFQTGLKILAAMSVAILTACNLDERVGGSSSLTISLSPAKLTETFTSGAQILLDVST